MVPAVEAEALRKVYRANGAEVEAVRRVDMAVAPGEFVAVMGPSGCGKSTLLHLLGGLDRPTSGTVRVAGRQIETLSESARAVLRRETVGFVFQAYNLVPNLTVEGNVELPALLVRKTRKEIVDRSDEILRALGLEDRRRAFPHELSGGEQQRAAIARALINRPAVLLADEPTGNLDTRTGEEVVRLLRDLHASGQAIVLVSHDPKVASAAERILFMRDGEFTDQADLAGSSDREAVIRNLIQLGS